MFGAQDAQPQQSAQCGSPDFTPPEISAGDHSVLLGEQASGGIGEVGHDIPFDIEAVGECRCG
jgi:hypothetical protein